MKIMVSVTEYIPALAVGVAASFEDKPTARKEMC